VKEGIIIMNMEKAEGVNQRTLELKKHVAVIHSNSKISLLQRKISNALLFHAYDDLLIKDEHEIQISTLTKLIDYDSHDHKKIKQALMDLLATVVEWNIVDGDKLDKEKVWNASSIIADASIDGSLCTYSYSGKMRKLLYHPSVYGRLNMQIQAKFQSSYGLALYENCNRYQDIGQTPWFELDKFRKLMGVDEDKYKIFRDFKTRVIDKSVEEVNKYSTLFVESKFKKQNRQVVAIQFSIKNRVVIDATSVTSELNSESLLSVLKGVYGLSQKQLQEVVSSYEESYIKEKIKIIELSTSYQSGKIKNLGKYLLCALADDYQSTKQPKIKRGHKDKRLTKEHEIAYQKYLHKIIFDTFYILGDETRAEMESSFKIIIAKSIYRAFYEKDGLEHILVQDQFIKFIMSYENEISKRVERLEEWVESI
jgi:plasmid replication initiation protein